MSDLDHWLESINAIWKRWRLQFSRFVPGAKIKREQLESDEALIRWQAIRELAQQPQIEHLPALLALSGDPDEMVRAEVVEALVSLGAEVTLKPVHQALAAANSPAFAVTLLETLARLPDPANRDVIQPWLADEDVHVRAAAFMALAALCDDGDLPPLADALEKEDVRVQRALMTTLCAPEAASLAIRCENSSDPILRQRAIQALPRIQRNLEAKQEAETKASPKKQSSNVSDAPYSSPEDVQSEVKENQEDREIDEMSVEQLDGE